MPFSVFKRRNWGKGGKGKEEEKQKSKKSELIKADDPSTTSEELFYSPKIVGSLRRMTSSRRVSEGELALFEDAVVRSERLRSDDSVSVASSLGEKTYGDGDESKCESKSGVGVNSSDKVKLRGSEYSTDSESSGGEYRSAVNPSEWNLNLPEYIDADSIDYSTIGNKENVETREAVRNTYSAPPYSEILVRGPGYLEGSKVVDRSKKIPSAAPPYAICGVNVFKSKHSLEHIATKVDSLRELLSSAASDIGESDDIFPPYLLICWNFKSLFHREYTCVAHLFKRDDRIVSTLSKPFRQAFAEFSKGTTAQQSERLKFFFRVQEGAPALRNSVQMLGGERPVLIAKKLTTKFFVQPNYIEISTDVGSSTVACMLNSTVSKTSRQMVVDTLWAIEAKEDSELPERILGAVRWNYVDINEIVVDLDH